MIKKSLVKEEIRKPKFSFYRQEMEKLTMREQPDPIDKPESNIDFYSGSGVVYNTFYKKPDSD